MNINFQPPIENVLSSNINSLFSYIDRHCHSLYAEWSTPIMFPQYVDSRKNYNNIAYFAPKKYTKLELDHSFKQAWFSISEYTIINRYNDEGFKILSRDIQRASVLSGFHVYKNDLHPIR